MCFFLIFKRFSPAPVGRFSRSRLRDTQGARLYTMAQVWIPGGLRGACSGRSKSRNLASNRGVAFREARAEQDNGKPTCQLFCSDKPRQNNTRFKLSPFLQRRTLLCVCGHCLCVCVLRMCYVCAGLVCVFVLEPHMSACFFALLLAAAVRIMSVSHRPSSSQALCFLQPRFNNSRASTSPFCDRHRRCISLRGFLRSMFPMGTNT